MRRRQKIEDEATTRRRVLDNAKYWGCEPEARIILDRYDRLLKRCTNEVERKQIALMGIAELHRLLEIRESLVVNGEEILPGEKKPNIT